jgi:hypothetical protein
MERTSSLQDVAAERRLRKYNVRPPLQVVLSDLATWKNGLLTTRAQTGALYVSRHNGGPVHENEVIEILKPFGAIESVFYPSETERELYQLPQGLWVRFAFFQDCRDAHTVRMCSIPTGSC